MKINLINKAKILKSNHKDTLSQAELNILGRLADVLWERYSISVWHFSFLEDSFN